MNTRIYWNGSDDDLHHRGTEGTEKNSFNSLSLCVLCVSVVNQNLLPILSTITNTRIYLVFCWIFAFSWFFFSGAALAQRLEQPSQERYEFVRHLTEENAKLAEMRADLAGKIEKASAECESMDQKLSLVKKNFHSIEEKAKVAGMSEAFGLLLRKKKAELPDLKIHELAVEARQSEISTVQLKMIEFDELRAVLDIESETKKIMAGRTIPPEEFAEIESTVSQQLKTRKQSLDLLLQEYDAYLVKLIDLDGREKELIEESSKYISFIEERILWVRSTKGLQISDLSKAWEGFSWLGDFKNWRGAFKSLLAEARIHPFLFVWALLILSGFIYARMLTPGKLQGFAALVTKAETDRFTYTVHALILTLTYGVCWPFLLWFIGWRMGMALAASEFTRCIAAALCETAEIYGALAIVFAICAANGLGESHFRWDGEAMRGLRKNLLWFMVIVLPLAFIVFAMNDQINDACGRLAFIVSMGAAAIFLAKVLYPSGALAQNMIRHWNILDKSRYLWYPLLILLPIGLAVVSAIGYYYTAFQLEQRLWKSLLLALVVLFLYEILLRWLLSIRNSLWIQRIVKIEETIQAGESKERESKEGEDNLAIMKARRLVRTLALLSLLLSLWLTWSDVLPALNILKRITLWNGVMLSEFLYAVVIAVLTAVANKNLPALLEVSILNRLRIEKSVSFAIVTIVRYTVLIIGTIAVCSLMGLMWSKVQWLVAAFTFGLAFGLQEIFANFISGIILLFERPLRVGDVVTIRGTTGIVSDIEIRATTITDWDGKDIVIPNKEFITGEFVNWTLTDTNLRIVVNVGIAYGSDTDLAHRILLRIAEENPNVLKNPVPKALFMQFGESFLKFELHVFIPDISVYLATIDQLHTAIDREFRKAGISLAFPQRAIHIRSFQNVLPVPKDSEES